jgi:hypothetical protein
MADADRIEDAMLGTLEWDDRLDWLVGETDFLPGHRTRVSIDPGVDELPGVLERCRAGFIRIRQQDLALRRIVAVQLMDLYNQWNPEQPLTEEEFAGGLRVASVDFWSDGGAMVYYDDGDVFFGGHNIVADLHPDGSLERARIEG